MNFWKIFKNEEFEKGQILRPFLGLAPLKVKFFSNNFKGMLCEYRGIICYHFQYGLWGGGRYLLAREFRP